jgi:opacity protein-like surface antigen
MAKYKALIIAGGALFALARSAGAADLLPPSPALEPPPPAPMEFNGWYLRGDVGLGVNANTPKFQSTPSPTAGLTDASDVFYNPTISSSGIFDLGVGYQFNSWFRADVSEELRGGSHFQALEVVNGTTSTPSTVQYADFYRGDLWSAVTLFNGYADLGTWWGITPYVGAGVGFAYNEVSGVTDTGYAYNSANTTQLSWPSGGYFDNQGKWNFAWDLAAGLTFNVTPNLKLDLGYRYLEYGKYATGTENCLTAGSATLNSCNGYTLHSRNELASNDFRIGLRWMIGEESYAPPPPLVRKY